MLKLIINIYPTHMIKINHTYIPYLDANNLYGWAMSQYLPTGGFKWKSNDIDVMDISDTSSKGYIAT